MNERVIGHKRQRERLEKLWRKNKLASTLMFSGESGIGKSLVAKELFRTLFCEQGETYGGCGVCRSCRLYDSGNHPDFHERDCLTKDNSSMEALRELTYSLHLNSFAGRSRAVLFHNSEYLSMQGANLLLKILEEPRPGTYFCLLTANPSRLPATILSRCHIWFFDQLQEQEIEEIVKRQGLIEATGVSAEEAAVLADGNMQNLASLEQHRDDWRVLQTRLDDFARGDCAGASDFAYELSKDRERLRERLRLMRIHARRRMLEAEDDDSRLSWSFSLSNLLDAEYLIFERNIGAAYVLSFIFIDLSDSARSGQNPRITRLRMLEEIVV